jgi:hypothetical protein
MPGSYSKYNTGYYVNYASTPQYLTSDMNEGPYTSDVSLFVNLGRNITDKSGGLKRGFAYYNNIFNVDATKKKLTGPYTAVQKFTDNKSNEYTVFKSGFIVQQLNAHVNSTNYNVSLIEKVDLQNDIVQSVVIKDTNEKKLLTFTNVKISNKTDFTTLNTRYVLSFDNAILTGVEKY